jgi:hypothetical protein
MNKYQVSVAAEAFVAALFAQAGYDVSVQYGANQPGYDLVALKADRMLKVSVKGSQDGGWNLLGTLKKGRSYKEALEEWVRRHGPGMVFGLVQFHATSVGEMPRVYVARAEEIATHVGQARNGEGGTILWEDHTWRRGKARGWADRIPDNWRFSQERIDSV